MPPKRRPAAIHTVPVLCKAIRLFEAVAKSSGGVTTKGLAVSLEISPTTCYRIPQSFVSQGWLSARRGGMYELSFALVPLLRPLLPHELLIETAKEPLRQLAVTTGLAAKLTVRHGDDAVTLVSSSSPKSTAITSRVGSVVSLAIVRCHPRDTGLTPPYDIDSLRTVQKNFAEAGITVVGLEGDEFDMQRIKLGRPGREEDIERYQRMLANMGELGIRLLCYNFMATIGWCRTDVHVPARGEAVTNRFQLAALDPMPVPEEDRVSEAQLWENYTWFIRQVLPAAERAGVTLGLHPDDPPVPPLRGVARIVTSPDAIGRALALSDSPAHGLTFCQANFRAMGGEVAAAARRFAARIVYVHFRDIEGDASDFTEVFHDAGPTDMPAMLRLYADLGFKGPIRVDHVPSLSGEQDLPHGYAYLGRLFAIGYMKGILDTARIAYARTATPPLTFQ